MELILLSVMYSVPAFIIAILCVKYDGPPANRITRKEVTLAFVLSAIPYINLFVIFFGSIFLIYLLGSRLWKSKWMNQESTLFNLKIKKVQKN